MTMREVMAALQVSRQTVYRMLDEGTLINVAPYNPALKLQRLRFDRDQVMALAPRPREV